VQRRGVHVMKRASIVLLVLSCAATAGAQTEKALAKEAYDRGTQAHARGDFKRAAEEFARADALAPSPIALQAALDAAIDADDYLLGADLLERSKRAKPTGALAGSVDAATKKLGGRAARLKVACPAGARCTATIDGTRFDAPKGTWLRPGPHTLVVQVDATPDTRTVEARAGEEMEVVAARAGAPASVAARAPASPPPATTPAVTAAPPSSKPLSPAVFGVATGVTVVLAGVATVFALSAKSKHGEFTDAGCDKVAAGDCAAKKDSGESAQTFANVGFVATSAAAVTTIVIAAFFTDWGSSTKAARAPVLVPIAGGMAAGWTTAF
jgi:hypothetical protein